MSFKISDLWSNPDKNFSIAANLLSIIGVAAGLWLWVDNKFETEFAKRLEPYEYLQEALSLMQTKQYERSIEPFNKALLGLVQQDISEQRLIAVAAPYMEALANVKDTHKYTHYFRQLKSMVDTKLPDQAEIKRDIGWIYLETGKPTEAIKMFRQSITVFMAETDENAASDAVWGIALSASALGETEAALNAYTLAYQLNSSAYSPADTVNYPITDKGSYGEKYIRIYPKFEESYAKLLSSIKVTYAIEDDQYEFSGEPNFNLLD